MGAGLLSDPFLSLTCSCCTTLSCLQSRTGQSLEAERALLIVTDLRCEASAVLPCSKPLLLTRGARTLMPTYTAAVRVKGGEGAKAWFPIHHRSSRSRHTNHTRGTRNADELIQPAPQNPTRCPSSRWRNHCTERPSNCTGKHSCLGAQVSAPSLQEEVAPTSPRHKFWSPIALLVVSHPSPHYPLVTLTRALPRGMPTPQAPLTLACGWLRTQASFDWAGDCVSEKMVS